MIQPTVQASEPSASSGQTRLPRNVRVLGVTSLVNDIASEMTYPLLPLFVSQVLGGTPLTLGTMEGIADTAASVLKLVSGAWSDRSATRKLWVVSGYLLAAVARPVAGLVGAPWQLVAVRLADRTGKGIRGAPRDALVVDSTDPGARGRAFGFQRAMDHLGAAIGPLLATAFLWLWPAGLRPLFLLTALPGLAVVLLVIFGLREEPRPRGADGSEAAQEAFHPTLAPLGRPFLVYLIAIVLFTLGNSSDAFLLWRAGQLGLASWLLPLLWSLFHIVKSSGSIVAGAWIDRFGSRVVLLTGWLTYAAVYACFGVAERLWHVWTLFLLYGVFYALAEPAERALVSQLAPRQHRGLAFGWFHLASGVANLPASLLFGALYYEFGATAAFWTGAVLAAVAASVLALVRLPRRSSG
jgi:MFS family permease